MEKKVRHRGAFDRALKIVCLLLAICGGLWGYWETRRASRQELDDLLRGARLLAETVNLHRLKALSGSASDPFLPEYLRLSEQMFSVLPAFPSGCSVSLLGRRADGALFYLLDVRASSRSALPGDEFPARTAYFHLPFDERQSLILGPFAEGGRTFSAALVPLADPATRRVAAVLLLEADVRHGWKESLEAALVPLGATLLLLLVLLGGSRFAFRFRDSAAFLYAETLWIASICFLLTGAFAWGVGSYEFRTRSRAFSILSDLESSALIRSLQEVRDCSLEGLGHFFESSEDVDAREFNDYVGHLIAVPHLDAVLWAPAVPSLSTGSGSPRDGRSPSSGYSLSFPVRYVAHAEQRIFSPGIDLRSVPSLNRALEIAVRSGMTTASEAAVVDGACRAVVFRPVRRSGGDLMGVVAAVLNLEILLRTTMIRDEGAGRHITEVELGSLLPGGEVRPLLSAPYIEDRYPKEPHAYGDSFHSVRPFFVLGQAFSLKTSSGAGFASMHPKRAGKIALYFGIAVSVLFTLLTALFLNWRRAMLRFVAIKTVSLARSELASRKLAHLYRSITEGVMITDAEGVIEECNPALEELTGFTLEEMLGRSPAIFSARDGQYDYEFLRTLGENGGWQGEVWNRKKDGEVYPVWLTIAAVRDDSGKTTHYSGVMRHIGGIKSEQERLNRMAYHDFLTGLPNRALFVDRLEVALARAKREEETIALVFLDLDRFKEVNDAFGHETGDALLVLVADRLSDAFREQDTVARLAGDEFVLLFEGLRKRDDLSPALRRLEELFREPFVLDGRSVAVEASFGVALFPRDGEDVRSLLDVADKKMYAEKTARRKRREEASGTDARRDPRPPAVVRGISAETPKEKVEGKGE